MRFLLIFLSLFFVHFTNAQNLLELKHKETGKTRTLSSKSKIQFKLNGDSAFTKAKIVQIKDSVLVLMLTDTDEEENPLADIKISDISSIKKASTFHSITKGIGAVVTPVGTVLFASGLVQLIRDDSFQGQSSDKGDAATLTAVGGGMMVIGIVPYIFKTKVYDLKGAYSYSVKKGTK